ncbi:MAG TPA: helix-turn-helix transcriptional regulator, partial [Longimicrobiales bacterium]
MAGRIRMTPAFFHVLLCLTDGSRHGYALLSEIEQRSGGGVRLGPSSLYYALGRLEDAGLIAEAPAPPGADEPHEDQRRYYALTPPGRERLAEEVAVMSNIVEHAEAR